MSERFPGGFMTQSPPTPSASNATGIWTLDQQEQLKQAGQWPANGPFFIEDVFSTWLYTGNGSTQTITNGIDLAGKGGLVWLKNRGAVSNHLLFWEPTSSPWLSSNTTAAAGTLGAGNEFTSSGFSLNSSSALTNASGNTYASWTFREQPKFFDVVTYTGSGTSQNIAHNLGSVPGCIIIKSTTSAVTWRVYHRSLATGLGALRLNSDSAAVSSSSFWNSTVPTSTQFTVGSDNSVNAIGQTYVAYLFAHNAGGFGLSGTDNVISCGSFTQVSGGTTVNLGYEPQWVMVKSANSTGNWFIFDNMRGNTVTLYPNLSNAEGDQGAGSFQYNATGFTMADYITGSVGSNLIYIAIRRGPMKTPTTGTSVFSPVTQTAAGTVTTGFPVDLAISGSRTSTGSKLSLDRLRGSSTNSYASLFTNSTGAEGTGTGSGFGFDNNTGYVDAFWSASSMAYWNFRRAPGFFDEVCYTNPPSSPVDQTRAHNLGVVPTLVISKGRNQTGGWIVLLDSSILGSVRYLQLNTTGAALSGLTYSGTATQYTTSFLGNFNETRVDYLFASCPGVSKVGSYTGTGTTQTINCGFTGGARFVLIKATSTTGDWLVWDSSRGIVAGNDPYLALNSTAAEVTTTDWVDTAATGFELSNASGNLANTNGTSYIFLSVA